MLSMPDKIFQLPSEAESYFNTAATNLLKDLTGAPKTGNKEQQGIGSTAHRYAVEIKNVKEIKSTGLVDGFGNTTAHFIKTKEGEIGLAGDKYSDCVKLIERLASRNEINNILSFNFIREMLFKWLKEKYENNIETEEFISYLTQESTRAIKTRKISIPIAHLAIETPFKVGNVLFEYFTKDLFDEMESTFKNNHPDDGQSSNEYFAKIRKKYQGVVSASISICAEKEKCIEIAKVETEKALTALNMYSPAAFIPEIPSYWGMMGKITVPTTYLFIFENHLPIISECIDSATGLLTKITDQFSCFSYLLIYFFSRFFNFSFNSRWLYSTVS